MDVSYKCRCMAAETTIQVPDRRPDSDLMQWMEMVQVCMAADHNALSPLCRAGEVEYLKIPFDDAAQGVGMKPTTN